MEGEKKRDLAALRKAGLARDPNWKPWRDPVFTERLYREDYAPGSAGQNGAHTPGEWVVGERGQIWSSTGFIAACGAQNWDAPTPDVLANARLIAAAPQMLEALRAAESDVFHYEEERGLHEHSDSVTNLVRAAIAAATGEAV